MKPKILVCGDSASIDTGFGRVAREICTSLQVGGKFEVVQYAWFHLSSEKLLPFKMIPTDTTTRALAEADKYGQLSFDAVIERVHPDIVLVIGDEWMIRHYGQRARNYVLVGYVPIDGAPMMDSWGVTFANFDHIVLYGKFAEHVVRKVVGSAMPISLIPHGVDLDTFYPMGETERKKCRASFTDRDDSFIVGCVARNNTRKQLPRLLKAYRQFINGWTTCKSCGNVAQQQMSACPMCHAVGDLLEHGEPKDNAMLYLHAVHNDHAGHPLIPLIRRFGLEGRVGIPDDMVVGRGVPDEVLNQFYNSFDLFTLPTSGEGWGLPILEAMAAGCPVLVTDYSAHQEFVHGAGEFINVAEWDTCNANCMERALVDINDYVFKLDRFYYESTEFFRKWGPYMLTNGYPQENFARVDTGKKLRRGMGQLAAERAKKYTWPDVNAQWAKLLWDLLPAEKKQAFGLRHDDDLSHLEII